MAAFHFSSHWQTTALYPQGPGIHVDPERSTVSCPFLAPILRPDFTGAVWLKVLEFASGVVATIELSRCSPYGYDQRFEVH